MTIVFSGETKSYNKGIRVKQKTGEYVGDLHWCKHDGFFFCACEDEFLSADDLRQVADKIDSLNETAMPFLAKEWGFYWPNKCAV